MNDREIKQYHYEAKYNVENLRFQQKLYEFLHEKLPRDLVMSIEHKEITHCGLKGYYKIYNDKIERRYLMDYDGKWYEVPKGISWLDKGYPVNEETLESFIHEIKTDYYLNRREQNE